MDPVLAGEFAGGNLLDERIEVDRIDGDDVGIAPHGVTESTHHRCQAVSPILPAMPRDHDAAGLRANMGLIPLPDGGHTLVEIGKADNSLHGIDYGIAGDKDG